MTETLGNPSETDLRALIAGLRSKRITAPFTELQISRVLTGSIASPVSMELQRLASLSFTAEQIAVTMELLVTDRQESRTADSPIDLVTSGPEAPGITNRDTSVVVRELFAHARTSVLVVGYAVYQGQRVFEALARRMMEVPELDVRFFLNISRPDGDTTASEILISRFAHRFKTTQWPAGHRLPEVYFDPRSIADDGPIRSSLHAKCAVVDAEHVFVSSANFTEAGQERNIEVGLNIRSKHLSIRLIAHFEQLHEHGLAIRAF